jgi:hypothetical protein
MVSGEFFAPSCAFLMAWSVPASCDFIVLFSDEVKTLSTKATPLKDHPQIPMCRYRIEVGNNNNVKPGNILGSIANEADMDI